nr:hypothetical protein [candidate division Zixibacteria bacterium]
MGKHKSKKKKTAPDDQPQMDQTENTENPPTIPGREKYLWIFLAAFLFIVSVVMVIYDFSLKSTVSDYDENLTNCSIMLDEAQEKLDKSERDLERTKRELQASRFGGAGENMVPPNYLEEYKRKGLDDPIGRIKRDLTEHQDIIPYQGTTGHAFRFHDIREIYVISPRLVFANITDNKVNGWMLLEYRVGDNGMITWKVVKSYCPFYDK